MQHSDDKFHPVAISQVMLNFAQRHGIDRQTCLLGTGIAEAELSSGEGLVTRTQEMRLIENLMLALPSVGVGVLSWACNTTWPLSGCGDLPYAPARPCAMLSPWAYAICR